MTTALASIASHPSTKTVDNPHMTMTSNDVLNVLLQGFLDEDGSMNGEEDNCIDDDGAVDHDKLEEYMDRQERENERKRNLLIALMSIAELEDQEQLAADAVDLRRHREQFSGLGSKKGGRRTFGFDLASFPGTHGKHSGSNFGARRSSTIAARNQFEEWKDH